MGRRVVGGPTGSLFGLSLDLILGFVPGFLKVLLQFRFGIPAAVANCPRLRCGGVAVLPLPRVVVHSGRRNGIVVERAAVFVHSRIVSQASMRRQGAVQHHDGPPGVVGDQVCVYCARRFNP